MEKTELDYRLELIKLVSYCSICRKNNTNYWMIYLCKHLNDVMEFLGEKDYLQYDGYGLKPTNEKEKLK